MRFKNAANICVIGAGRFGQAVVNRLYQLKMHVTIIDKDSKAIVPIKDKIIANYVLNASDQQALESVNISDFDTVIVSISENIEIIALLLELNVKNIIARSNSSQHSRVLKHIGVNAIIRPEEEGGIKAANIAANSNYFFFSDKLTQLARDFFIGSIVIDNPKFLNKALKNLNFNKYNVSIVMILRNDVAFLPNGDSILQNNDRVTFIGSVENLSKVLLAVSLNLNKQMIESELKKKNFIDTTTDRKEDDF